MCLPTPNYSINHGAGDENAQNTWRQDASARPRGRRSAARLAVFPPRLGRAAALGLGRTVAEPPLSATPPHALRDDARRAAPQAAPRAAPWLRRSATPRPRLSLASASPRPRRRFDAPSLGARHSRAAPLRRLRSAEPRQRLSRLARASAARPWPLRRPRPRLVRGARLRRAALVHVAARRAVPRLAGPLGSAAASPRGQLGGRAQSTTSRPEQAGLSHILPSNLLGRGPFSAATLSTK